MSDKNKPNWKEWKHMPEIQVWQACVLSLDIEPNSIKRNSRSWETGPGIDQLFEADSFQSENKKNEFENRQRMLLNNLYSKENSLWFKPNDNCPNLGYVSLPEFAAWCPSVEWSIPKELAALAKKQIISVPTKNKQEKKEVYTKDKTEKDKQDALVIADILLSKDRLRCGVLDEVIGLAVQKAESMSISKVYPELWELAKTKKAPFNGTVKDGGMAYYNYKAVLVRINKKALEKRLDRLKKKYL